MKTPIRTYNLKAVSRETGLSAATLRAWERRYGVLQPRRSPGGHRMYSEEDVRLLKWLVARQAEGLSISRAVDLWRELEAAGQFPTAPEPAPAAGARPPASTLADLRRAWIEACMLFDEQSAEQAVGQAFAIASPEVVCIEVLQKGLAEIGQAWYAGTASVQQEHFASALALRRLEALLLAAPPPTRPERLLAACPPNEQHDFVLLLLTYLLRRQGWDVVYLGANVPTARLDAVIRVVTPRLVIATVQTLENAAALREMAWSVNASGGMLAYGGGVFVRNPALTRRIPGHYLGSELAAAPQIVKGLLTEKRQPPTVQPVTPAYQAALEQLNEREALITVSVLDEMQGHPVNPERLKEVHLHFNRYVQAALRLGDLDFLEPSVGWILELLDEEQPSAAGHYLAAYRQAVFKHLGEQGQLITGWLDRFNPAERTD